MSIPCSTLELWFKVIVNKFDILMPFTEGPQNDQDSTKCHTYTAQRGILCQCDGIVPTKTNINSSIICIGITPSHRQVE